MITETLLAVALGLVEWIVSITPDFGLDLSLDIASNLAYIGGLAYTMNAWLPVDTIVICLVLLFGVQVVLTLWGFVVWLYHQFWGSN